MKNRDTMKNILVCFKFTSYMNTNNKYRKFSLFKHEDQSSLKNINHILSGSALLHGSDADIFSHYFHFFNLTSHKIQNKKYVQWPNT